MAKRTKRLTSQGDETEDVRINRFLSEAGVCSRREADRYIAEGKVKIDGVTAEMGSKVTKDNNVTFFDKPVKKEEKLVLIAFNKPEGIVCTTDQREPDNIIDYIHYGMRIYPIGRLDKDSEGLILLTNDGSIVNKILRAENNHEKEYIVTVNKEINPEFIKAMSSGVPILDTVTKPCAVKQIDKYSFDIILTQGLNRQIRRMCEYLDYRVTALRRIRVMNIRLGRLKTGDYRNVTEKEIEELNRSFQIKSNIGSYHEAHVPEKEVSLRRTASIKAETDKQSDHITADYKVREKASVHKRLKHKSKGDSAGGRKAGNSILGGSVGGRKAGNSILGGSTGGRKAGNSILREAAGSRKAENKGQGTAGSKAYAGRRTEGNKQGKSSGSKTNFRKQQ